MPSVSSGPTFWPRTNTSTSKASWINGLPNTSPAFHRYQEGGAIGGPILHNKLFFFGDYEATQQQQFDGSNTFTVPTTAERTGDFSGDSFTIYNPLVPDNADGNRQPFANNIIPNPNPSRAEVPLRDAQVQCNVPASLRYATPAAQ